MKILSDDVFSEMQVTLSWLRTQSDIKDATILGLTTQIIELKRDGFDRPRIGSVAQPTEKVVDDRIMRAIRARAPEGSSLERELVQYADALLLSEVEIEDVADAIMAGSTLGDD